ncbi:toll/interleukin-1 receptor domain-containing protein [Agrobacterium tumefaciens]|uniref:toll/interleukin-1 receptor domain-containing protein n=1 Tax=Agrobacterium tumefaciens TaxID=358 RepID=UPI001571CC81|nr:TIR domain-containing protein [Agrobacterium tumefaciens]NTE35227.1 TIR domain-containing protein [Agrobacterium tumefaciens]NTE50737.1 TIR domain-containing protein [Agrobacterium tumefaciens]
MTAQAYDYDVALSFAGEDRAYVEQVAHALAGKGVKVFYDMFEEAELWGKDLYVHLSEIYRHRARFTVMFISKAYTEKLWTRHERKAAQARAFEKLEDYILPAVFDDAQVEGILPTTGYTSLSRKTPNELADLVIKKLVLTGGTVPTNLVRGDFGSLSATPAIVPSKCTLRILDKEGNAIRSAIAILQAENGTTIKGKGLDDGTYEFDVHVRRAYHLLVAHPQYPCSVREQVDPECDLIVTLPTMPGIGSVIIDSTGYIPGLIGRLNPIRDTSNRLYLYADNVAINSGKPQPVIFELDTPIELEDANGTIVLAVVKHIKASTSLIQFMGKAEAHTGAVDG